MGYVNDLAAYLGITTSEGYLLLRAATGRKDEEINKHDLRNLARIGDSVIELVVNDFLFHHYREMPPGYHETLCSCLVRDTTLRQAGKIIGIDKIAQANKLAICFEAIIGAVYVYFGKGDAATGFTRASTIVHEHLIEPFRSGQITLEPTAGLNLVLAKMGRPLATYKSKRQVDNENHRQHAGGFYHADWTSADLFDPKDQKDEAYRPDCAFPGIGHSV